MLEYHQSSRAIGSDCGDENPSHMYKNILSSVSIDMSRHFIDYIVEGATGMYQAKCLLTLLSFFFEYKDDSQWTHVKKTNQRMQFQR